MWEERCHMSRRENYPSFSYCLVKISNEYVHASHIFFTNNAFAVDAWPRACYAVKNYVEKRKKRP